MAPDSPYRDMPLVMLHLCSLVLLFCKHQHYSLEGGLMRKGTIIAVVVFAAFACFAEKPQAGKAAGGTETHGYQWAVHNGDAWKWVSVPLSAEEQESLNQAIQQAGGLNAN